MVHTYFYASNGSLERRARRVVDVYRKWVGRERGGRYVQFPSSCQRVLSRSAIRPLLGSLSPDHQIQRRSRYFQQAYIPLLLPISPWLQITPVSKYLVQVSRWRIFPILHSGQPTFHSRYRLTTPLIVNLLCSHRSPPVSYRKSDQGLMHEPVAGLVSVGY